MSLPEPAHRLPRAAKGYWRASVLGQAAVPAVGALVLTDVWDELQIPTWLPFVLVVVLAVAAAAVVPEVRWRRWRYEIRDEEIDLRHGTFTVRRTLVPIRRVQHVDTSTGAVQGTFDLATVSFHTAAGRTQIPALTRTEAEDVRRHVGRLARTRDDT